jgi:hypothetical protein
MRAKRDRSEKPAEKAASVTERPRRSNRAAS